MSGYNLCRCVSAAGIRNEFTILSLPVISAQTLRNQRIRSGTYMHSQKSSMTISRPYRTVTKDSRMPMYDGNSTVTLLNTKQRGQWRNQNRFSSSENFKVKRFYALNPFKWLDLKLKMFLLRGFFDKNFDEEEFLEGAKQAICLVSSYISQGKFDLLDGLLSEKATDDSRKMCDDATDRKKLEVRRNDIEMIRISNIGFEYEKNGRKWADVLVTCFCVSEDSVSKKIGNIEIIGIPSQRVFNFAFVREFTPGVTSNWIVNRMEVFKNFV